MMKKRLFILWLLSCWWGDMKSQTQGNNMSQARLTCTSSPVSLSSTTISNYDYDVNTQLFFDDFGISDLSVEKGRVRTPYMPANSFKFGRAISPANPYPNNGPCVFADGIEKLDQARITDGYYAVVAPPYLKKGWWQNDCWLTGVSGESWYWWTGAYDENDPQFPLVKDRSGTMNGAVLVINAGNTSKPFYQRKATLQVGARYKASMWIYLVVAPKDSNGVKKSTKVAIDIIDPSNNRVLHTTNATALGPHREKQWTEVKIEYEFPASSQFATCNSMEVLISFRNIDPTVSGNDYYVDDLKVEKVRDAATCPPVNNCVTSNKKYVDLTTLIPPSSVPSGYEVQWFTTRNRTSGTRVSDPTRVTQTGTYYPFYYNSRLNCYNQASSSVKVDATIYRLCTCTKPANTQTGGSPTKFGITNLRKTEQWPENIPNGFIALESKTKGLVITRVPKSADIQEPKKGMLIYDIKDQCIKLYNGAIWKCIERSCNDY